MQKYSTKFGEKMKPATQKKRSAKSGLPPGSPVHVGKVSDELIKISVLDYDQTFAAQKELTSVSECRSLLSSESITWINIDGLHDIEIISQLGTMFTIHPLTIEDILNTQQRAKIDIFDDHIYVVAKMLTRVAAGGEIETEQISMVVGENYVLTFQEKQGDIFDCVRKRIMEGKGRIRQCRSDYLMYSLIDTIIDGYFFVLEGVDEQIERLDDGVFSSPSPEVLNQIHSLKRETAYLRKSIWPLREVVLSLTRQDSPLIFDSTVIYLNDLYDHSIQVIESIDTSREILSSTLEVYLSTVSNKMNEVMKVLTVFAVIFIPLTFISSIYGMNFNTEKSPFNMPELNWYFGYPFAIGMMLVITITMLLYFKRKKWF